MLELKYYDLKKTQKLVKDWRQLREGWEHTIYGGIRAQYFESAVHKSIEERAHVAGRPSIDEFTFELHVELSILEAVKRPNMVFIELGAGWGTQTLNVVTAVRNRVVDTAVKSVYSYAVEPDPGHYRFLCSTFLENQIKGLPIFGAVSGDVGWVCFDATLPPADNYGQSIDSKKGNIIIPCFTLNNLIETFKITRVDLIHMDIQHAELAAIEGALDIIDRIDYLMICPHRDTRVGVIKDMLNVTHNLILSHGSRSGYHKVAGFPLPIHQPQDGLMVWERRTL